MGRYAGWIALHSAVAGGAHVCLIPEIPYDIPKVVERIYQRFTKGRGFAIIVVAEGAKPKDGEMYYEESDETGYKNVRLGGVATKLMRELKEGGLEADMRETVLGHLQRGGTPIAYDRVLATQFGVKAFEMVLEGKFGEMVAYRHPNIVSVPFKEAIAQYNFVDPGSDLVKTARGVGICLGD
jgi:6-phosphofructokinase 1